MNQVFIRPLQGMIVMKRWEELSLGNGADKAGEQILVNKEL